MNLKFIESYIEYYKIIITGQIQLLKNPGNSLKNGYILCLKPLKFVV